MRCKFKWVNDEILEGELLYIKDSHAIILVDEDGWKRSCDVLAKDIIEATCVEEWF